MCLFIVLSRSELLFESNFDFGSQSLFAPIDLPIEEPFVTRDLALQERLEVASDEGVRVLAAACTTLNEIDQGVCLFHCSKYIGTLLVIPDFDLKGLSREPSQDFHLILNGFEEALEELFALHLSVEIVNVLIHHLSVYWNLYSITSSFCLCSSVSVNGS